MRSCPPRGLPIASPLPGDRPSGPRVVAPRVRRTVALRVIADASGAAAVSAGRPAVAHISRVIDLETLASCVDLTSDHAKHAASSSASMRSLLERVCRHRPPRRRLPGDDEATTLTVMVDYGVGIRERILRSARFAIPFDELARALELAPDSCGRCGSARSARSSSSRRSSSRRSSRPRSRGAAASYLRGRRPQPRRGSAQDRTASARGGPASRELQGGSADAAEPHDADRQG